MSDVKDTMERISKSSYMSIGLVISIVGLAYLGGSRVGQLQANQTNHRLLIEEKVSKEVYDAEISHINATLERIETKTDALLIKQVNSKEDD